MTDGKICKFFLGKMENIEGKGEYGGNQHFLFPKCFLPFPELNISLSVKFILSSADALNLDQLTILSFGNELTL